MRLRGTGGFAEPAASRLGVLRLAILCSGRCGSRRLCGLGRGPRGSQNLRFRGWARCSWRPCVPRCAVYGGCMAWAAACGSAEPAAPPLRVLATLRHSTIAQSARRGFGPRRPCCGHVIPQLAKRPTGSASRPLHLLRFQLRGSATSACPSARRTEVCCVGSPVPRFSGCPPLLAPPRGHHLPPRRFVSRTSRLRGFPSFLGPAIWARRAGGQSRRRPCGRGRWATPAPRLVRRGPVARPRGRGRPATASARRRRPAGSARGRRSPASAPRSGGPTPASRR